MYLRKIKRLKGIYLALQESVYDILRNLAVFRWMTFTRALILSINNARNFKNGYLTIPRASLRATCPFLTLTARTITLTLAALTWIPLMNKATLSIGRGIRQRISCANGARKRTTARTRS